jgi:hypothetical protein
MAKYYFRDLNEPERNYSISLIDVSSLRGYEGQELKIGDPIQLNSTEYYNEKSSDDVQKSLNKYLFITDIDYELRKDSDISLTINPIKYQDSIVKRLVKLIK